MSKTRAPRFTSPEGIAVWPRLNDPDTKYKQEGEYTVKLAFDPDEKAVDRLINQMEAMRDEQFAQWLSENPRKKRGAEVAEVFTEEVDEEGEPTGRILLNFKMRASGVSKKTGKKWAMKPDIFDAGKKLLRNPPQIGSGSKLKVNFEASGWFVESAKKFYLSFRMNAVQLLDLVEFGVRDADAYGFDEEEGFEASNDHIERKFEDSGRDDSDDDHAEDDGDY